MAASNSSLNNSIAYGYVKNVIAKTIINVATLNGVKCKIIETTNKFKPIEIKLGRRVVSCIANSKSDGTIALSLYHMMNAKNIGFIHNNSVYIIDGDVLRSNWNSILSNHNKYVDGCGSTSVMTYANIDSIIALADTTYKLDNELVEFIEKKKNEYFK